MLGTIIRKEILDYLKSTKFLIGMLIAVTLLILSTIINIQDYRSRVQDHLNAQNELKGEAIDIVLYRAPQVLSPFVQGLDRKLGSQIKLSVLNIPSRTSGYMGEYSSQHHRYMSGFTAVDFDFLVRVVLSLLVIFLGYNAVSEEKFQGTLKLVLSNAVPRDQVLLGKFLGGLTVVGGALLISMLLSHLLLYASSAVTLTGTDWARITMMTGMSALYLICFFTLSLFISVVASRPSTALMILLQIWVFLVILYPNLAVIAAENIYRLPNEETLSRQKDAALLPYRDQFQKALQDFHHMVSSGKSDKEVSSRYLDMWTLQEALGLKVDEDFNKKMTRQAELVEILAIISPAVIYDQSMTRFARTDLVDYERFMAGVVRLWQKLVERAKLRYKDIQAYKQTPQPTFEYTPERTSECLAFSVLRGSLMIFFSLIFFVLAYTGFLKKDVR